MKTLAEDRYYEPEDDDNEDIEDFIADWVKYETRQGGICDPREKTNFYEAVGELQLREEIATWEECTMAEQNLIAGYWLDRAYKMAVEAYYEG